MAKNTKKPKNKYTKQIIRWFWILFTVIILSIVAFFALIANGKIGYMPPVQDLENPIDKYASEVFSVDQQLMGTYSYNKANRVYVNYNELSPYLVQALISTEDIRYAKHSGIDAYALARAVIKRGLLFREEAGGGSTISQQLAKLLYTEHAKTFVERLSQKPIEWVIAVQLERHYTKEEIINIYLNQFDFLHNAVGIQSAAWVYFGKQPKELTVEEAATLIGMCKNPTLFNPMKYVERTTGRRNVVIDLMCKNGCLSRAEADSIKQIPLTTRYHKAGHTDGIAPYFRTQLATMMTAQKPEKKNYRDWQKLKFQEDSLAWATNPLYGWCNKNKKSDGSSYNLYTDGLKLYTTIDSRMQKYAEQAVESHVVNDLQGRFNKEKAKSKIAPFALSDEFKEKDIKRVMDQSMKTSDRYYALKNNLKKSDEEIEKIFNTPIEMQVYSPAGTIDTLMTPIDSIRYMKSYLRTGFMSMDPRNGAIKAYVGGTDFRYFKYDMVSLGKRQVGSIAKPYLYSLAMESGITPCDEILKIQPEIPLENGKIWRPKDSNKSRMGEVVTVKWGLQLSDNWITATLMGRLSPYTFANLVRAYGVLNPVDPVVSSCLGTYDASVSEMVSGYTTFVNGGIRVEPMMVTRIEDREGNILATFAPRMQEVISENANYKMLNMLQGVVDGGTGGRIRRAPHNVKVAMGGKTGTTQDNSDGWFVGFTPSLVSGCWVGGEHRSIRFQSMTYGQGAGSALPVVGIFLNKVYNDRNLGYSSSETFDIPEQYINPCPSNVSLFDMNYTSGMIDEDFQ